MIPDLPAKTNALVMSYVGIRRAIGISGLLLPVVLGPIGWLMGIDIQVNISSYYHTPLRDIFVGTMCSIGVFLLCYRGHDRIENWTANLGCAAALGVGLFPLDKNYDPLYQQTISGNLHTLCGGLFFFTLSLYSLYHFPRFGSEPGEREPHQWERSFVYRTSGVVILFSVLAMAAYLIAIPRPWKETLDDYCFLFWMEWVATWAFAAAWLTKGRIIVAEVALDLISIPRQALAERIPLLRDRESEA